MRKIIMDKFKKHPLSMFGDFRKVFAGRVISAIGDKFFAIAIAWWVVSSGDENSKMHLGLLMAVNVVPVILFGPFLGTLVDRSNKRMTMLIADAFRMIFVFSLAMVMFTGNLNLVILYGLCFLVSMFGPMFEASVSSSLLRLTSKESLASAAALDSSVMQISNVFGSALGSICIAIIGVAGAFFFDSITYALSFIIIYMVKTNLAPVVEAESNYWGEFKKGIHYIVKNRPIFSLMLTFAAFNFFVGPILILIPMIVKFTLNESVTWLAIFETFFAFGACSIAVIMSFRKKHGNIYIMFFGSLMLMGLSFLGLYFTGDKYLITLLLLSAGCAIGTGNALALTLFQHAVDEEMKGRFFSVLTTICYAVLPFTFMLNGFLAEQISIKFSILMNSLAIIALSFIVLIIPRIKSEVNSQ
ncbi:MAG: MFS transporter [Elusimicrobiales bacterium]|nr:MFS transporter [Elusimicrobiales bacterium]